MLVTKVIFLLLAILALGKTQNCREIMKSYYQTEDQYYDLGCDAKNLGSKTLLYRCRFLQKKMDIVGRQYYDLGHWSQWRPCLNGYQERVKESCTGRKETESKSCRSESMSKVLVATGFPHHPWGRQIQEIIDLKNESFVCNKVPQYPQKVLGAAGGLIQGNIPLICSGFNGYLPKDDYKKCYALKNKKWKHVTNLHIARQFMGSGSVVLKGKLLISGGVTGPIRKKCRKGCPELHTTSSELVSEHSSAFTSNLPLKLAMHCNIKINETTILITGGRLVRGGGYKSTFQNVETGRFIEGPRFKNLRSHGHGCGKFTFKGKTYALVAFGRLNSVEILDLENIDKGWKIIGRKTPDGYRYLRYLTLVVINDSDVYIIGGYHGSQVKSIFKFECGETLESCQWVRMKQALKFARRSHVAFPIPDSLANEICN